MQIVESFAEKYIKKGMHLGDNDPGKGVFGRYKITLKESFWWSIHVTV